MFHDTQEKWSYCKTYFHYTKSYRKRQLHIERKLILRHILILFAVEIFIILPNVALISVQSIHIGPGSAFAIHL